MNHLNEALKSALKSALKYALKFKSAKSTDSLKFKSMNSLPMLSR